MKLMGHEVIVRSGDFAQQGKDTGWQRYKELAKKNGICYDTFISRTQTLGMLPKEAASTPIKQKMNRLVWVGDYLATRKAHCSALGLNYSSICSYMSRYGLDFESAVLRRLADTNEELYHETIGRKDGHSGET